MSKGAPKGPVGLWAVSSMSASMAVQARPWPWGSRGLRSVAVLALFSLMLLMRDLQQLTISSCSLSNAPSSFSIPIFASAQEVEEVDGNMIDEYYDDEDIGSNASSASSKSSTTTLNIKERGAFEKLLGDTIYTWGEAEASESGEQQVAVYEVATADMLQGKRYVALYFSASW
jgi:hypothetical protein